MRIGILTFHRSHNYGAFLQAFALSHSLQEQFPDSSVEIIDYDTKASHKQYLVRVVKTGRIPGIPYFAKEYRMFMKQLKRLPLSDKSLITDDYNMFKREFEDIYDLIVVGSDEVWVTTGMRGFPNAFWLPGEYKPIKISYAASSRSEMSRMPLDKQEKLHKYINDFRYVGARDEATIYELNKFLEDGKIAHFNPDPVFTWDFGDVKEIGRKILREKFGIKDEEKTIGFMVTKKTNASIIISSAKEHGYTPIALYKRQKGAINAVLDPFEWFAVIAAVDGIVTALFHGMCFSIKYDTPFIAFEERNISPERSKMYDLLKRIERKERFITENDNVGEAIAALITNNAVDFSECRKKLYDQFIYSIMEIKESIK